MFNLLVFNDEQNVINNLTVGHIMILSNYAYKALKSTSSIIIAFSIVIICQWKILHITDCLSNEDINHTP